MPAAAAEQHLVLWVVAWRLARLSVFQQGLLTLHHAMIVFWLLIGQLCGCGVSRSVVLPSAVQGISSKAAPAAGQHRRTMYCSVLGFYLCILSMAPASPRRLRVAVY